MRTDGKHGHCRVLAVEVSLVGVQKGLKQGPFLCRAVLDCPARYQGEDRSLPCTWEVGRASGGRNAAAGRYLVSVVP
jgi:hypothetical protein